MSGILACEREREREHQKKLLEAYKTREAIEAVKRMANEADKSNAKSIWEIILINSLPFFLGSLLTFFSVVVALCIML